jgi:glycerol-3-phosphate responsive antiterminator
MEKQEYKVEVKFVNQKVDCKGIVTVEAYTPTAAKNLAVDSIKRQFGTITKVCTKIL